MRRVFKLVGFATATLALFVTVAALAAYHLIRAGELRRFLIDEIERHTELKVELGEAEIEIGWIAGLVFRQLAISKADAAQPSITAESVTARVALRPLLERRVVFYEIRLSKPVARVASDADGHVPLLDKLLNLPFLKETEREFQVDLRSVRIQNGEIEYVDGRAPAKSGTWRLLNTSISLERVGGEKLRAFVQDPLGRARREAAAAVEFSVRGTAEKDRVRTSVKVDGRVLFPEDALDFQQARWIADVELVEYPAALLKEHVALGVPIQSMAGHIAQRMHLDGHPRRQMRVRGDMEFRQLSVNAPELLRAPIAGADGRALFEFDWSRQALRIKRFDFRSGEMKFSLHGEVRSLDSEDPDYSLEVHGLSAPLLLLRQYVPVKMAAGVPWLEQALDGLQGGSVEVKRAGVRARLSDVRRLAESGFGQRLWFDAELRDAAGKLPLEHSLPVRALQGRISLDKGILRLDRLRGSYGDSRLYEVAGAFELGPPLGAGELLVSGDFSLGELRQHLQAGLLPAGVRFASSVQELAGRGKGRVVIKTGGTAPLQFDGTIEVDDARLRYGDFLLSEVYGTLRFSPREVRGDKVRGQMRGSPLQIQFAVTDYASENGAFDVLFESKGIRAELVTRLLLDSAAREDSGIVRGWARYRGSLGSRENRRLSGDLELVDVQLALQLLLQPLRELHGRVKFDESGIDFEEIRASLVGFPASASGRWRYGARPQLLFDFAAPYLDVTYLISQIDPEASEFYANLHALGRIHISRGRLKNFEFSDLQTDTALDRRVWRLSNLTAASAGGAIRGTTTIVDKPDTLGVAAEPKIQGVPIETFLKWFNMTNTEMTGKVFLGGKLETAGDNDAERTKNINGAFSLRIEDGIILRMRLLVQILNLLDLSRWFTLQLPDLAKDGIRFRSITGDFKVAQGVFTTENLVVDSNDLRMTGTGRIDLARDEVNFIVAVRPFAGIDAAIHQIPILGRGLAAIKNSFLVASFNISGRIDEPAITPAPLGTLSEMFWSVLGIPKSILGMGESERRKDESKSPGGSPAK